ncbi:receptor-type adenylate cyclase [Trypanosoma conorhini]|uniref:Receptor-type adenylate cyclase n=1 Tax=Trypanosoma conorhini TaxID=83891 RepID=A0A422NB27_9TRYP|nr:receptor-type adenylate cyclase [Trypanosoma conorhini]RNF02678.1 receptor-type adenylate cyclase [Trypanosoma conorhini]
MAVCWGRRGCCAQLGLRPPAAAPCLLFLVVVVLPLLLLLALPCAGAQTAAARKVVKVVAFRFSFQILDDFSRNIVAGLNASLHSRNFIVEDDVRVEIVLQNTTFATYPSDLSAVLRDNNDIYAVVGHCGDRLLENIKGALAQENVVAFAPFTGSSVVRGWNPNVYFLRADPGAELLALLRYAVTELQVLRLGFMYLQDVSYGDREYEQAERVLSAMGYALSGVFTVKSAVQGGADPTEFDDAWERFAATRPQAVIVFGSPIADTMKFIRRMLTDARTAGAYLLVPSALQDVLLSNWRAVVDNGSAKFVPGQVITTGTNPLAKDARYDAIRRFQAVMREYLKNSGQRDYNDTEHFLNNDGDGELMVDGWIAGEVLAQALSNPKWVKDRNSFKASLFNQRRYVVNDLVIGDFGGECEGAAASQGATCRCNQGGRTVYMKRLVQDYRAEGLDGGTFVLPFSECQASNLKLRGFLVGIFFRLRIFHGLRALLCSWKLPCMTK